MRETNESEIPGVIVPSGALASEAVDAIDTLAAISTGVGQTLVDVGLAVLAREPWDALACVPGDIRRVKDTEIGKSLGKASTKSPVVRSDRCLIC